MGASAAAPRPDLVELVEGIRAGTDGFEAALVERFSRGVRFLLLELSGDPARADDLHQETFRLVIEKVRAGELREPAALAGFVRQIARNLFYGEIRSRRRRREEEGDEVVAVQPDPSPSPLRRLMAKESARRVRRALDELGQPRDRELLVRYFVAEHPKDEICRDLGLTSLHFNRVLHRARQRLRAVLADEGGTSARGAP